MGSPGNVAMQLSRIALSSTDVVVAVGVADAVDDCCCYDVADTAAAVAAGIVVVVVVVAAAVCY